jgi:cation diffusion facilitator CzcD-associated flavoprotein CzcO
MARERNRVCIIVGAGVSGLVQAAELLRKDILQPEEVEILDRSNDYGGVWNAATYPGAGCDVFSVLYQVSWFRKAGKISFSGSLCLSHIADHHAVSQTGVVSFQEAANLQTTSDSSPRNFSCVLAQPSTRMSSRRFGLTRRWSGV